MKKWMQMKVEPIGKLLELSVDETDLQFETARDAARSEARRIDPQAMLLSWHSGRTGDYYPKIECGRQDRAPWLVWADSRGANLTISVNRGAFVFYYLTGVLTDPRAYRSNRSLP